MKIQEEILQIREAAEADLETFIRLVAPYQVIPSFHKELIQFWTRPDAKNHQLTLIPRDHGKALRLDQRVLTSSGWKETGEILVGDQVIGFDGKPTEVIALHPVEVMDLYKVQTRDGREVICSGQHLWTVQCPSNTSDKLVTKETQEILKNYKSPRFDKRNGKEYVEYRYFLPTVEPIEFEEKDLPIDPYTLGAWLGDGHSASSEFTSADPELISFLPYEVRKTAGKYRYNIIGIHSILRKMGLLNNKHIPQEYLFASIKQREALLQGLLDTDGTVHQDGKWVYFDQCAKREHLVDQVVDLVRSLGGSATKRGYTSYLNGEGFPSFGVTIKLPDSISPFRLSRKAEKFVGSVGTRSAIINIEKVEPGEARCITVANEDGLYVTEDYMVTHNSRLIAFWVTWMLTKNPALRILYISATSNLAEKQLGFIKNILTSDIYRRYWGEMVNKQESKRSKWTNSEIELDHPLRKEQGVRDPSIFTAGLTTGITGLHCDISVLDDVVVQENALTQEGRTRVALQYSLLSSIEGAGSRQMVVGTRYHPKDLYQNMLDMKKQIFDKDGELIKEEAIYEVFERKLENVGDGTGEYLWARDKTTDGRWFGFDQNIRAEKYAKYEDKRQFWAQYYNTPNPPGELAIDPSRFQYYDNHLVKQNYGQWYFGNYRLNVYAAIDFAFSLKGRADSTAIVVLGVDSDKRIYILDIIRFKSDKISDYYKYICAAHTKWGFRKLRAEVSVGQAVIVKELKEQYIRPNGLAISIDEFKPNRHNGTKQERIAAILEPRYDNLMVWHYRGGNCSLLEEELISQNPVHDDIKDALASCIEICVPPSRTVDKQGTDGVVIFNKRWGGIA